MPKPRFLSLLGFTLGLLFLIAGCNEDSEAIIDPAIMRKGARVAKSCNACHRLEKRQNEIGPNLVGVLGRNAGSVADYNYSEALKTSHLKWNVENLKAFLMNPQGVVPGTKMAIAGISTDEADALIAYLRSIQ